MWYHVKCLGHDTSVRQHYKSEHWAPCRNQTPSWYDWKIVESDVKPEYTHTYIEKNDSGLKTREAYKHSVYMNCPHVRHTCMSKASTWYVSQNRELLLNQSIDQSINQSINQSIIHSFIHSFIKSKRKTLGSANNHDKTDNPCIVVTKQFKITLHVYLVCHTVFLNVFQQRWYCYSLKILLLHSSSLK